MQSKLGGSGKRPNGKRKPPSDQVEGTSKPCIMILGELRDGADAILEMNGAVGNIIARPDQGSFIIQNIGNGAALNVRYRFSRPDDNPAQPRNVRFIPNVMPTGRVTLVERIGNYRELHEAIFEYGSINGRKYRSTVQINNRVLTGFHFIEVKN